MGLASKLRESNAYNPQTNNNAPVQAPQWTAPVSFDRPQATIDVNQITEKLLTNRKQNQLEKFYSKEDIPKIAQKTSQQVNFQALAEFFRIPTSLALELSILALYDIVVFADDSGSMRFEDNGARIQDLKNILGRVSQISTLFDSDGISIRFFNDYTIKGDNIKSFADASALVDRNTFQGVTKLGTELFNQVLDPMTNKRTMKKPMLVYIITDGEPYGEPRETIMDVLKKSKKKNGTGVSFQFAQVGKDLKAQAFLSQLDENSKFGDIVDTTSYYELEAEQFRKMGVNLTPELWLLKLMLGAIDHSYDSQDERK
jgi:uncharacterized protein YegL